MPNFDFVAANHLEELLAQAQTGVIPLSDFLAALMRAEVHIPSAEEIEPDAGALMPMFFDRGGESLVAAFTAKDRVKKYAHDFPFCLSMTGAKCFAWIPTQCGIVLNPGFRVGMEIPAKGVKDIVRDFAPK
jgi:hypothetical protein